MKKKIKNKKAKNQKNLRKKMKDILLMRLIIIKKTTIRHHLNLEIHLLKIMIKIVIKKIELNVL